MPYDNVYSEKRTPGALRTVWRNFYGDTTAMIGFYGCIGLVLLCVLGSWFAPYGIDQQFRVISFYRRRGRVTGRFRSSWGLTISDATC